VAALALTLGVLGATAGVAWGERQERTHEATAVILLNPTEGNPFSPEGTAGADLVNLETEAQLVVSDEVGRLVGDRRGGESPEAELVNVSAEVPPNTQLIEIAVSDRSIEDALERAQAFAEVFLDYRRSRTETAVFDRGAAVKEQIQRQSDQLDEHVRALDEARPSSSEALLLEQQIIEVTAHLGQLRSQAAGIDAAPVDPGQVVTPATLGGTGPLAPRALGGLLGLVVGLGGGLAWGVSRVRLAGWIRGPDDLPDGGPPVLAVLSPAPAEDQLGRLRAGVLARNGRRPLVISVAALKGEAATPAPLAGSLARANLEVVLVEAGGAPIADDPEPGLVDLLRGEADADQVLQSRTRHLTVLSAGTEPEALEDLLVAPEMGLLVDDLGKRADVVLLASPDSSTSRAQALAHLADIVLVEVVVGRATVDDVTAALSALDHAASNDRAALVLLGSGR
jgi:hypothetical protein